MPPTPPPSVEADTAKPSAATLAAHQAVAETLRISIETRPEIKRRRALEHLAESGFAPSHVSTAAILCTFNQSSEPIAKVWLRDIKASSDRDLIDEFATGFFSFDPDLRGLKLLNLASSTNELALQSRLEALKPGVDINDEGPADLASTVTAAKEVFTAKPTERHRVTRKSSVRASQWSRLQHRWRKGRAIVRSSSGPPHWISPTAIANAIRQPSREETANEKQGANGTTIAIFIAIFVLIKIFSALGRSSVNNTPKYQTPSPPKTRTEDYRQYDEQQEAIRRFSDAVDRAYQGSDKRKPSIETTPDGKPGIVVPSEGDKIDALPLLDPFEMLDSSTAEPAPSDSLIPKPRESELDLLEGWPAFPGTPESTPPSNASPNSPPPNEPNLEIDF